MTISLGFVSFNKSIEKVISVLDYTVNKLHLFESVSSANEPKLDGLVELFKKNGRVEYAEFIYNGCIVSMYGALERLVEDLLEECIDKTNAIVSSYDDLSNSIRKNHTTFSFDLASKINRDRNLDDTQKIKKQKEIIENLQSCFTGKSYTLNKRAFSSHTANFRFDIIRESFSNVGISDVFFKIVNCSELRTQLMAEIGLNHSEYVGDQQLNAELKSKLDDLAFKRNEISHGSKPDSYLNYELLLQLSKFIQLFGQALKDCCLDYLLNLETTSIDLTSAYYIKVSNPKIFTKQKVIGLQVSNIEKLIGKNINKNVDVYLVNSRSTSDKKIKASISSIVINDNFVDSHTISAPFSMCISLNIELRQSFDKRDVYIKLS